MGAATNAPFNAFLNAVETQILTPIVTLLVLAAFIVFIWGVVEYVRNAANDEKRAEGQQHIFWGLIGLAIIFGATAIVNIITNLATSL